MGKRLYTEVAAARHMSSGTDRSPVFEEEVVRASGGFKAEPARAYRRKRAVAMILTVGVFVSVPVLVTLLVFFG
ncbi:hypothetical protein H9638_15575 [Arthrobacter sp. Sa2BUA2]|uniref:Peptide ABC transporter permease n=1 Tax=Arthrobacter pullicola TaxID=2762224 RepID=A0ABR8YLY5_9MICC|nr:hypothetical protein [Arthrobacter pullicola]MBD8045230.1 hypothetical protein [Arthrobacter pullicola]